MRWVDAARARFRLLLFGGEVEQRMDEEFRFHLDMETERLVREAGVDPREARRRARAAFGGLEAQKDAVRDIRGGWVRLQLGVGRDIRDGMRSLAKRPAFTAVAILSLALGIGANTAIFSLVNAVILRDSPIERPDEVVNVYLHQAAFEFGSLSYPDFEDVRDGTAAVFSDIAASHFVPLTIDRGEGGVGLAPAEAVTGSYFPMLGIEAAVGRTLLPSDDVSRGGHPVVMLDYRYWQSAFAGDPDVVGHEMRVGGRAYTVIGVGPPDFAGTLRGLVPTFYVPYMMAEELNGAPLFDHRGQSSLFVKARLRPGVTLSRAEAAVGAVAAQLTRDRIPNWDPAGQFALLPLTDVLLFPPLDGYVRGAAWLLMVVVGLVLLLACTNLASFLLARALDRRNGRPLRGGQLRRRPADARDRHPAGARRRRPPRRAAARRRWPEACGPRRRARSGARRRRDPPAGRAAVRGRRARPADVRRRAAGPRRRRPPRRLATGPPRQPGQSRRGAPDRLSAGRPTAAPAQRRVT